MSIEHIRRDYTWGELSEADVASDPIVQFKHWLDAAVRVPLPEPTAMTLATATADGLPDARIVLLRKVDETGFVFFTNFESAKGQQMAQNPWATLLFFWMEMERQVRIFGRVSRATDAEADEYFALRPRPSQVAAWASDQSRPLVSREDLDARIAEYDEKFASHAVVPRPPFWGGYRITPEIVEFWQGRASRLHDRLRYTKTDAGDWRIDRLAP